MNQARVRLFVWVIAAALAAPFVPFEASAEKRECSTWFPDFSKCDRSGRYEGFTMPISMPYLFEDPFITTGLQMVGIWHDIPGSAGGGDLWVLALQARIAITDKLAFIATKDGYTWWDSTAIGSPNGAWDLAFGLKYAFLENREDKYIVSGSLRFDVPAGQAQVLSGNGSGVIIPGLHAGWGIDKLHVLGNLGFRIPFDVDAESTSFFYNVAVSYNLFKHLVPIIEMGGHNWMGAGAGTSFGGALPGVEGVDVVNLGSLFVKGKNIVTMSFGARIPIVKHVTAGMAYELPVTGTKDIFNQRVTMNLLWEF